MNLLLEEYKLINENYKINIIQAATIARFYTGTTLILIGGIVAKIASTTSEQLSLASVYILPLLIILLIWSFQALIMMYGIFKSRTKTINRLNQMRIELFKNETYNLDINYPNTKSVKRTSILTYLAFAIYPLVVIGITIWMYIQLQTNPL